MASNDRGTDELSFDDLYDWIESHPEITVKSVGIGMPGANACILPEIVFDFRGIEWTVPGQDLQDVILKVESLLATSARGLRK